MLPGDKTRVPLRTGESDSEGYPRQLTLTVVFHPDLGRIGATMALGTLDSSGSLRLAATTVGRNAPTFVDGLPLSEPHVSRQALKLMHHPRGLQLSDASSESHLHMGPDRSSSMALSLSDLERGISIRFGHAVVCWLRLSPSPVAPFEGEHGDFVGVSPESQSIRRLIRTAASCDLPVLLRGESGVGKEVVAQCIHGQSLRAGTPMVSVNMAALPETLADAELFGTAKGAFTGAEQRCGYFQSADRGTLFLDEIGELPNALQPKLLRALQGGEIQIVGGKPQRVDVRIIAASDADLDDVALFKTPLLQRLAGITLRIPALSSRREDMGLLLLSHETTRSTNTVSLALEAAQTSAHRAAAWASFIYNALNTDWPGNVRAFLLAAQRHALEIDQRSEAYSQRHSHGAGLTAEHTSVSDAFLVSTHEASHFEIAETARRVGLSRQAVYRRLEHIPEIRLAGQLPDRELLVAIDHVGKDPTQLSRYLKVSRAAISQRLKQLGVHR